MASCRDSPPYLVSVETVREFLLPAETTAHDEWLPVETVRVILLPAETLDRKQNHTSTISAGSHFTRTVVSAGSKSSRTVSAEAKIDGESLQEAKFGGLVYTLCTQAI
ncbi:MAG: hypothetical protein AB2693_35330 [Candidatus Thiodiazotropha sp.]